MREQIGPQSTLQKGEIKRVFYHRRKEVGVKRTGIITFTIYIHH
jgi:hypothetical protein